MEKSSQIKNKRYWNPSPNSMAFSSKQRSLSFLIPDSWASHHHLALGHDIGQGPQGLPTSAFAPHHTPGPAGQLHLVTLAFQQFLTLTNSLPNRTAAWDLMEAGASPPSCTRKASSAETPPKAQLSRAGLPALLSQHQSPFWELSDFIFHGLILL